CPPGAAGRGGRRGQESIRLRSDRPRRSGGRARAAGHRDDRASRHRGGRGARGFRHRRLRGRGGDHGPAAPGRGLAAHDRALSGPAGPHGDPRWAPRGGEGSGSGHSEVRGRFITLSSMTSGGTADESGAAVEQKRRLKQPFVFRRHHFTPTGVLDYLFFLFGGAASTWLALLILLKGFSLGWWQVLTLLVFWGVVSYLALPRLHRILSQIYVPNYFIGRTRTSDGLLGDPVNLAWRGEEAQIHHAMRAAGWILADSITPASTWEIIRSTVMKRSYPQAPVSPLLLFGRRQDFAYQQEIDGDP